MNEKEEDMGNLKKFKTFYETDSSGYFKVDEQKGNEMAYYFDYSDSDDDHMSDDCDYIDYKERIRKLNTQPTLTEAEKLEQIKKAIYISVCNGDTSQVIQHLDDGLDININLEDNWTLLLLSVSIGNVELTSELLKRKADVYIRRDCWTALMMACNCPKTTSPFEESLKVIEMLVDRGVNVKAINRKRMTALMFAANTGNLPAVKYLLPLSDKNAEDNQRWTAIFWAVYRNNVEVVEYLLQEGLECNIVDIRNNTPLDIAKNNDYQEILALFEDGSTDDTLSTILNMKMQSFEELFQQRHQKIPDFFMDICNFLQSTNSETAINSFAESNITLKEFLSMSENDLKKIDIKFPYVRYKISAGIYKFHKQLFHPKSIHVVHSNEIFSNLDLATQLLTVIKQLIAMDASLTYIMRNKMPEELSAPELVPLMKYIESIRTRINIYKSVAEKLAVKTKQWDENVTPVDLITSNSRNYRLPWRKILVSLSISSLVVIYKMKK